MQGSDPLSEWVVAADIDGSHDEQGNSTDLEARVVVPVGGDEPNVVWLALAQ